MGRTLSTLCQDMNIHELDKLTATMVKRKMRYFEIPEQDCWRVPMVKELIGIRNGELTVPGFSTEECNDILSQLCVT